jgi:hypothetical protein
MKFSVKYSFSMCYSVKYFIYQFISVKYVSRSESPELLNMNYIQALKTTDSPKTTHPLNTECAIIQTLLSAVETTLQLHRRSKV